MVGDAPSCALWGRFAIGNGANAKCQQVLVVAPCLL